MNINKLVMIIRFMNIQKSNYEYLKRGHFAQVLNNQIIAAPSVVS
jgi:hypothetical protein